MGVHLLVLPFKMGIYRKRNVHQIGSSLEIPGAYSGKISCYAPPVRDPRGLSWQNLFMRPAGPNKLLPVSRTVSSFYAQF